MTRSRDPRLLQIDFDAGTLILSGRLPPAVAADVPALRWDPRVQRYRAPAWCHGPLLSTLRSRGMRVLDEAAPWERLLLGSDLTS